MAGSMASYESATPIIAAARARGEAEAARLSSCYLRRRGARIRGILSLMQDASRYTRRGRDMERGSGCPTSSCSPTRTTVRVTASDIPGLATSTSPKATGADVLRRSPRIEQRSARNCPRLPGARNASSTTESNRVTHGREMNDERCRPHHKSWGIVFMGPLPAISCEPRRSP